MPKKIKNPASPPVRNPHLGKVGGSVQAARSIGGKLDFGIPAKRAHPASRRVKTNVDSPSVRAGQDGQRVVGVGAVGATPGKSGGAVDTDILGIGTPGGSSVSTDGTLGQSTGEDLTQGGSAPFASGPPAQGRHPKNLVGKVGGNKRVPGTTHNAGDPDGSQGAGVGDRVDMAQRDVEDPNKNNQR